MAANPYVSVPAGRVSQQALWVQAYYRNLALQNAYQQQQGQYGDALAAGLGKGIGAGFDQYFGQLDQTNKFNNASLLQSQQDAAATQRQLVSNQQQNDLLAQREQAAAEAEQRKAIIAQLLEQQKTNNIGAATAGLVQGMQPQPQPDSLYQTSAAGNEPPVFQGGQEQPPQTYTDLNSVANAPIQPQLGDVLSGLASRGLGGYVDKSLIEKYMGQPKGMTDAEALARFKEAQGMAGYDPAGAAKMIEGTPFAGMPLIAKPATPEKMPFSDTFNQYLGALGYTREAYDALPPERKQAIEAAFNKRQDDRAAELRKTEVQATQAALDMRTRYEQADAAERDFTTIRAMIPKIQLDVAKLLQPGVEGKAIGLGKEKMQTWFGKYPEIQELVSEGEAIKGAITRRVLLESGQLTDKDTVRAIALIPQASDNLETGMAKLRVLQVFMDAAWQAWEAYRNSGLMASGRPAAKTVNDFLPPGFWQQADALKAASKGPGGPWVKE